MRTPISKTTKWKTKKKLKSPLENSPRWTVSRGELERQMEDRKRKIQVAPWEQSTVNCLASRTSNNPKWKTRREKHWSRPLRTVHDKLSREKNSQLRNGRHEEQKNVEVAPWEQSTVNCLARRTSTRNERHEEEKNLIEVAPWEQSTVNYLARRTSTRNERHEEEKNLIEVAPWEQSTVNCLARRTSTRKKRHGYDKAKPFECSHLSCPKFLRALFESSPARAWVEDARRLILPPSLQHSTECASPKSLCTWITNPPIVSIVVRIFPAPNN